jgi:hypothetical protein
MLFSSTFSIMLFLFSCLSFLTISSENACIHFKLSIFQLTFQSIFTSIFFDVNAFNAFVFVVILSFFWFSTLFVVSVVSVFISSLILFTFSEFKYFSHKTICLKAIQIITAIIIDQKIIPMYQELKSKVMLNHTLRLMIQVSLSIFFIK